MRTSVELPDPLFREAKRYGAEHGVTLKELIERGLRTVLDQQREPKRGARLKLRTYGSQGYVPGIEEGSWEQIRDIIFDRSDAAS